jgi:hypothetical protein
VTRVGAGRNLVDMLSKNGNVHGGCNSFNIAKLRGHTDLHAHILANRFNFPRKLDRTLPGRLQVSFEVDQQEWFMGIQLRYASATMVPYSYESLGLILRNDFSYTREAFCSPMGR